MNGILDATPDVLYITLGTKRKRGRPKIQYCLEKYPIREHTLPAVPEAPHDDVLLGKKDVGFITSVKLTVLNAAFVIIVSAHRALL